MKLAIFLLSIVFMFSCNGSKQFVAPTPQFENFDTLVISAPKPLELKKAGEIEMDVHHETFERKFDLIHTVLDLRFDWAKEHVLGKATLTLTPVFYNQKSISLDAVNMDFHKVKVNGKALKFENTGKQLIIQFEKEKSKGDQIEIWIDYTAKPSDRKDIGGSSAIRSNKGLFFINADGASLKKEMQIWSQGETEHNKNWFPTIDHPNERCTQETYLTVTNGLTTLSNGILVSTKDNKDGTHTDYWKMDKPHAPYLFMIAIGDYAKTTETWNGIPVEYYVYQDMGKHASKIFEFTPEMLEFFSQRLGYTYPWSKYAQIITQDYVSGAMENTTAVIFGEFTQKDKYKIEERSNQSIVAHEMFHHWFGDLLTCESWSNLSLNEGFATYGEILWLEHKYGKEYAEIYRLSDMEGYLREAGRKRRSIFDYKYMNAEDMFDGHSYAKGGLVLNMLRNYVGDKAFFTSLAKYLKDNQYSAVELDELRLAFEDTTGKDLTRFFNQWFESPGHPMIDVSKEFSGNTLTLKLTQYQPIRNNLPVFFLPLEVVFYFKNGKKESRFIEMTKREEFFTFEFSENPIDVELDPHHIQICEIKEELTVLQRKNRYQNTSGIISKLLQYQWLSQNLKGNDFNQFILSAANDSVSAIQSRALYLLEDSEASRKLLLNFLNKNTERLFKIKGLNAVLKLVQSWDMMEAIPGLIHAMNRTENQMYKGDILVAIYNLDKEKAMDIIQKARPINSDHFLNKLIIRDKITNDLLIEIYKESLQTVNEEDALSRYKDYVYLMHNDEDLKKKAILELVEIVKNNDSKSRRWSATKAIYSHLEKLTKNLNGGALNRMELYRLDIFEKLLNAHKKYGDDWYAKRIQLAKYY